MRARPGLAALAAATSLGGALATAAPAAALNCAQFKTAMQTAVNGADIVLDQGQTCNDTYFIPDVPAPFSIKIRGGGSGATLDGTGHTVPIISGAPSPGNQLHVTIQNLTFRNGTASSATGGAISLGTGDVGATIDRARFFNNHATGGGGGAVHVQSSAGTRGLVVSNSVFGDGTAAGANSADNFGALDVASVGPSGPPVSVFGNTFNHNVAQLSGGGASVVGATGTTSVNDNKFIGNTAGDVAGAVRLGGAAIELMRNSFQGNKVQNALSTASQGGAVAAFSSAGNETINQRGNSFVGNKVNHGAQSEFSSYGGAEFLRGYAMTSRNDRFIGNSIQGAVGSGESEGGALALEGCSTSGPIDSRLENAAIAANVAGAKTRGAGLYAGGCSTGPVRLALINSTIAANKTGGAGATANLFGGPDDRLTMRNSIVLRALGGGANLAGFAAGRTVTYSDVCAPSKLSGVGNICAPAVLSDPDHGDIRQTRGSPTINAGRNAAIAGGPAHDYEGNNRILLGRVDMGADEYLDPFAGVLIPTQTQKISVKAQAVNVNVTCPAKVRGPCAGELRLVHKATQLGQGSFSIPRGQTKAVTVSLTKDAVDAVRAAGTFQSTAKATSDDGFGKTAKSSGKVTLTK